MFRVRTTVIELVMMAATVVVHCTFSKHCGMMSILIMKQIEAHGFIGLTRL